MQHRARRTSFPISKLTAAIALLTLLLVSACGLVHKQVETEKLLTPLSEATTTDLISTVNQLVGVQSIRGRVDIQFEDTSFASFGIADQYRQVDGDITLQRPGKIYLVIQFLLVDIAQMTSDGEQFRVVFTE